MKILIVGGTSSLAHALKPALSGFADVITAGRKDCDLLLDLGDVASAFTMLEGIDVVINTAATFGGATIGDFEQAVKVNVLGTLNLCRLCSEARVRHLVLISSIFAPLGLHSPFYSAYTLSKRQADEWAELHMSRSGLPLTIVRPAQFYGTGIVNRRHQPFLSTIIERVRRHEDVLIYGTNDALRNFIHVEDVAEIIARIVRQRLLGTYDCANPDNVRYSQVAAAAINAFASNSAIRFLRDKPDIPDNAFKADDRLYREIGYHPRISIEMGMRMEAAHSKETM